MFLTANIGLTPSKTVGPGIVACPSFIVESSVRYYALPCSYFVEPITPSIRHTSTPSIIKVSHPSPCLTRAPGSTVALDQKIYELRKDKLKQIEALGQSAYPYRYETTHTIPQIVEEFSSKTGGGTGIAARQRQRCRAADVDPRAGQGWLRASAARRQAAADLRPARLRWREGLSALQAARHRRLHRREGLSLPHPHQRADGPRRGDHLPGEGPASLAGEVARAAGRGDALSPPLRRSHDESRGARGLHQARQGRAVDAALSRRAWLRGSGDADDASHRRRRRGQAVHHAPQHAGCRSLPAHRARALSEAAGGRRHGPRLRDQSQLPQRRHLDPAQSRVHHAGVLHGLRGLSRHDGLHGGDAGAGGARRERHDRRALQWTGS